MDLSELLNSLAATEGRLDALEFWLAVSTLAVVLGLVLEYWHSVREILRDWANNHTLPRRKLLELIGGVLVTIGVSGELVIQYLASRAEMNLKNANTRIIGELSGRIVSERILRENALSADKLSRRERSGNPLLIGRLLKPLSGTSVEVEAVPDFECQRTADLIESALKIGGWKLTPATAIDRSSMFDSAPGVRIEAMGNLAQAAGTVAKVLTDCGIPATTQTPELRPLVVPSRVRIFVALDH